MMFYDRSDSGPPHSTLLRLPGDFTSTIDEIIGLPNAWILAGLYLAARNHELRFLARSNHSQDRVLSTRPSVQRLTLQPLARKVNFLSTR